jgi:methyl-accepting chemotaxis protein
MTTATESTAAQIKLITRANREHSSVAGRVLDQLRDIRTISDRNARDVNETRGNTAALMEHAADLAALVGRGTNGTNGKRGRVNGRG